MNARFEEIRYRLPSFSAGTVLNVGMLAGGCRNAVITAWCQSRARVDGPPRGQMDALGKCLCWWQIRYRQRSASERVQPEESMSACCSKVVRTYYSTLCTLVQRLSVEKDRLFSCITIFSFHSGILTSYSYHPSARGALIPMLIGKGVDVNDKNNKGETALIVAVENNRPEIVEALLAQKADPNVKFTNKEFSPKPITAIDLAKLMAHQECLMALKKKRKKLFFR